MRRGSGLGLALSPDIDVVKQSVLLTLALGTLWMLWSGHLEPLLLGFGAISIAFVVWLARRMHVVDKEGYPFGMVPRLSGYWPWLLKEIVKSNIDVARRVLGPATAVKPVVFDAPTNQRTDLGVVIYANSITLTPGTVSLNIAPGAIRVHAIHPDVARGLLDSGMGDRVRDTEQG